MLLVRIWPAWAFITDLSHWSVFTISTIVSKLAIDHWHELQCQKGCTVQGVCDLGSNMIGHTCHGSLPAITLIIYWKMSKPLWLFSGHKQCATLGMKLLHLFACMSDTRKDWHFFSYFLQVSYAIGVAEPLSLTVFHFGTSSKTEKELLQIVNNNFDLRPGKIVKWVQLPLFWTVFENPLSIQWMLIRF